MRAGIYVRLSDDREGTGLAVERQEQDCRALADRLGWTVTNVYTENDTSAYKRRKVILPDGTAALRVIRPAFRQLLTDLDTGTLAALIGYDLDRIARDPRDLEDLIDVIEQRQRPATSVTGSLDLSNDAGITMARVMVAMANKSSRDSSRRIRRKYQQMAEAGLNFNGGHRPFGWNPDRMTHHEIEAPILRYAYESVAAGKGLRTLCREFAEQGITTTLGGPWTNQSLRYTLMSARHAGLRSHKGKVVADATWPAIIERELWDAARARLTANTRIGHAPPFARRYLLTGYLFCGLCGARLNPARSADVQRFACRPEPGNGKCGKILIRYSPLEEHVVELLIARIEAEVDLKPEPDDPTVALRLQIAEREERLRNLAAAYADGGDFLEMRTLADRWRGEIADLRRAMAEVTTRRLAAPLELREAWPQMALEQRRAVVDLLIDGIDVAPARPGNTFQADRLTVRWR